MFYIHIILCDTVSSIYSRLGDIKNKMMCKKKAVFSE